MRELRELYLPLFHPIAGGFEDSAFAVGEALDAVFGNFVEDGIDFAADEFLFGRFIRLVGLRERPRPGFDGGRFDEFAFSLMCLERAPRPRYLAEAQAPFDECRAGEETAKVRCVSDVRSARKHSEQSQSDADPEQSFASHRYGEEIDEQREAIGPIEECESADQSGDARRSADDPAAELKGKARGERHLKKCANDSGDQVQLHEAEFSQSSFGRTSEEEQSEHIENQMRPTSMKELIGDQLPDVTLPQSFETQPNVIVWNKTWEDRQLKEEDDDIDDEQDDGR